MILPYLQGSHENKSLTDKGLISLVLFSSIPLKLTELFLAKLNTKPNEDQLYDERILFVTNLMNIVFKI